MSHFSPFSKQRFTTSTHVTGHNIMICPIFHVHLNIKETPAILQMNHISSISKPISADRTGVRVAKMERTFQSAVSTYLDNKI